MKTRVIKIPEKPIYLVEKFEDNQWLGVRDFRSLLAAEAFAERLFLTGDGEEVVKEFG